VGLVVIAVLAVPAVVLAVPDDSATVRFGNPGAGSFVPGVVENGSFNAQDNLIPRTVNIARGGTVTYEIAGFHQPAIYEPGTQPSDITVPPFPQFEFINDSSGRIAGGLGPLNIPPGTQSWESPALTQPGTYLVLCNFIPHFAFAKMYGWVNVK
jgi:hypothetical protein